VSLVGRDLVPVVRAHRAALLEALAAVHRLVLRRQERNFRLLATIAADGRVHGPLGAVTTATTAAIAVSAAVTAVIALSLAGRAAGRTALGLGVTSLCIERLLAGGKCKGLPAVTAG